MQKSENREILVSVIIPAYNCERYLAQALDSALEQQVPLEIIVINDCSKDGTEAVVKQYLKYPRSAMSKMRGILERRAAGTGEYVWRRENMWRSWMPMTGGRRASWKNR